MCCLIQYETFKKQGMGIIFITHKMAEVFQLCDAVTIMRDGEFMGERQSAECSESELISLMVGRDLGNYYVRTYNKPGDIMMEVKNINAGKRAIDCSFSGKKRRDTWFLRTGRSRKI